jgi:putative GTP pyrophosphokinase
MAEPSGAGAPSGNQVKKAGKVLRAWWDTPPEQEGERPDPKVLAAIGVLRAYRAAHQRPLYKATMGLRSMVKTVGGGKRAVSQRLKRTPSAIAKLARFENMQLSTMHDIAGCRAVVQTVGQIRAIHARLAKKGRVVDVDDYITQPAPSGYRGLHVIVKYTDAQKVPRNVEVQLRTNVMHEWAVTVEEVGGRHGWDLKGGRGPQEVLDFFSLASQAMALVEAGKPVPEELQTRWQSAQLRAAPLLARGLTP